VLTVPDLDQGSLFAISNTRPTRPNTVLSESIGDSVTKAVSGQQSQIDIVNGKVGGAGFVLGQDFFCTLVVPQDARMRRQIANAVLLRAVSKTQSFPLPAGKIL